MSIFHEHCQPKLKYCSSVIYANTDFTNELKFPVSAAKFASGVFLRKNGSLNELGQRFLIFL